MSETVDACNEAADEPVGSDASKQRRTVAGHLGALSASDVRDGSLAKISRWSSGPSNPEAFGDFAAAKAGVGRVEHRLKDALVNEWAYSRLWKSDVARVRVRAP